MIALRLPRRPKPVPVALLATIAFATASSSCKRTETVQATARVAPSASAQPTGADRLAPGELAAGREHPFGLAVPRDMRVVREFVHEAVAVGDVGIEPLARFIAQRVDSDAVQMAATRAVFPRAHVKGQPENAALKIEIMKKGPFQPTQLVLWDLTPPPFDPTLSEEERWKRAGLGPDGKQLDTNKMR
jgi:hypothetical protein